MTQRLDLQAGAMTGKVVKAIITGARRLRDSSIPTTTQELVALRVSQINGCGYCVDMHTKDAEHNGETSQRLHLVAVWRESAVFTDAERAALALAEEGTRIGDGRFVSDEVWAQAQKHYDEEQLSVLVLVIGLMNATNRWNVIAQRPAGDYVPGVYH